MALSHRGYCRDCSTENTSFTYLAHDSHRYSSTGVTKWVVVFTCPSCAEARVVTGQCQVQFNPGHESGLIENHRYFVITNDEPKREFRIAPEHTDTRVADLFKQAVTALESGSADAAGGMFRKSLDVATKKLTSDVPEAQGQWLKARIETMRNNGMLTEALYEWATIIKDEGDDASHDEDPYTLEEAKELSEFTEVFLMYVYTIPKKIKDRNSPD